MQHETTLDVDMLKTQLLKEVNTLYKRDGRVWKEPIVQTLRDLQKLGVRAVIFGGTLRSLLVARVLDNAPGRPRDVDIVVSGISLEDLRHQFERIISRETRFGGLQLLRSNWQFDVWPLQRTWAFERDAIVEPEFAALPSTTFFNLEAIAVDAWPQPGRPRRIYGGDGQFFNGILAKTLEINREENPYPTLCVVRALLLSRDLDFKIGPRLAVYIKQNGASIRADELCHLQRQHYGRMREDPQTLQEWIALVSEEHTRNPSEPIYLPIPRRLRQLRFSTVSKEATCVRFHALVE